ncbi:hypothetical protein [Parabacteroides sp.]
MKRRLLFLFAVFMVATSVGWGQTSDSWKSYASSSLTPSGDVYSISSAGDLAWVMNQVNAGTTNFSGKTVQLTTDLDLSEHLWEAIGNSTAHAFTGTFDGQSHKIFNMKIDVDVSANESSAGVGGLFGCIGGGAVIKDVSVVSGSISVKAFSQAYAGTFAADASASGSSVLIENCHSSIPVAIEITSTNGSNKLDAFAAGIVGRIVGNNTNPAEDTNWAIIRKCSSTGKITSKAQSVQTNAVLAGGLAGRVQSTKIQECFSTGDIEVTGGYTPYAGGLVGHSSYYGFISNCYSLSNVTSSSDITRDAYSIVGGICGSVSKDSKIDYCYATGSLSASLPSTTNSGSEVWAGGIAGYTIDKIYGVKVDNCIALNPSITINPSSSVPSENYLSSRIYGKLAPENTTLSNVYAYGGMKMICNNTPFYPETVTATSQNGLICSLDNIKSVFANSDVWTLSDNDLPILKNNAGATKSLSDYDFTAVNNTADLLAAIKAGWDKVLLVEGTYTLSEVAVLSQSVVVEGTDSAKCIIQGTWEINGTEPVFASFKNVTLTETASSSKNTTTPMIDVNSNNANLTLEHVLVKPVAPGDENKRACIDVSNGKNLTITKSTVTVNNSTLLLEKSNIIGLLVIDSHCDFSMDNSRIMSNENVNNLSGLRTILSKAEKGSTFTINNSLLSVGDNYHYAIWVQRPEQHFIINNSNVYGWAAFYMQGAWFKEADGMTLKAKNSSFTGVGKSGASNGFGVIVFEATDNSSVDMENCTVTSKIVEGTGNYGFIPPFVFQVGGANSVTGGRVLKPCTGCSVRLKDCTIQNGAEATTPAMISCNNNICVFDEDGDTTPEYSRLDGYMDTRNRVFVEGNTQFLNQDGSASIVVQAQDTLRNAAATLPNALVYMDAPKENVLVHVPIAFPNDEVVASSMGWEDALSALNAQDAMPVDYELPRNVKIICKDAVLVSGDEIYAIEYANQHPEKYVKALKQTLNPSSPALMFSVVDKTIDLVIASDTTWATSFADRNVKINKGATLTITAPMALATVTMEEGAQLKAGTNEVTAKSLQLTYSLEANKWKAIGFPMAFTVKDQAGNAIAAPADKDADNGPWFAGLVEGGKSPVLEVKNAFAEAGLLATDAASTYTLASVATSDISLKEQKEPVAPTAQGTFLLCANPNTYDMTLTQKVYVLTEDGLSFEQAEAPVIKAFQCFVLADEATYSTLRSLRVDNSIVTGIQTIDPVEGYYVATEPGTIVIHTAKAVDVLVVGMSGKVAYRGKATDGQRILVPAGIYAVNGQLFRVK